MRKLIAVLFVLVCVTESQAFFLGFAGHRGRNTVVINNGVGVGGVYRPGFHHHHNNGVGVGAGFYRGYNHVAINNNFGLAAPVQYAPVQQFAAPIQQGFSMQYSQQQFAAPMDPCLPPANFAAPVDPCALPGIGRGFRRGIGY